MSNGTAHYQIHEVHTPIFRRLAFRALELAGRFPWLALFTLRVFFAMKTHLR